MSEWINDILGEPPNDFEYVKCEFCTNPNETMVFDFNGHVICQDCYFNRLKEINDKIEKI